MVWWWCCRYEVMLKDAESEKIEMLSHEVLNILADERNYKFAATVSQQPGQAGSSMGQ